MNLEIRTSTLAWIIVLVVAATLVTCGKVEQTTNDTAPDGTCVWDQGRWDDCQFAP